MLMIEATGLTKSYGDQHVLSGIDLAVPDGTVFGLLGPNGAGKTTAVRMLATLTEPDSGRARVAGHDVVTARAAVRAAISLTGQYAALDELQTGVENLVMMGRLRGLRPRAARQRATELLERFDLVEAGRRRTGTYSGGMRRRLDLAASLITEPQVLFLDEPTTGLDPRSRRQLWDVVRGLRDAGTTVFLTTQYLEEADRLADRIAVIEGGRVAAEGSAAELKRALGSDRLDLTCTGERAYGELAAALGDRAVHRDPSALTLGAVTTGDARDVRALLEALDPDGGRIARFAITPATLDDVFLSLTDREVSDV